MALNDASPRLVGLGVGPGDPELVTLKALRTLEQADVVLVPATEASTKAGMGRAEIIVRTVCPAAGDAIRPIPFSMADRSGVSTRRKESWLASAEAAVEAFGGGARLVAFATVGDPNVYSTFSYLAAHVLEQLPDVKVETVPGITAMQALASASGTPLVEGTETLALVPVTAGLETLGRILDSVDTVVAYKGGRRIGDVVEVLHEHQREGVLGIQLGMEDEQLLRTEELAQGQQAPYFSTVLAPARREGTGGRL